LVIIKDGQDKEILAKHYFGNAFTNYALPQLNLKPIKDNIAVSGIHHFIVEFHSLCDAGINPCKDFLPQDIFILRYPHLCIPLDQQDPPYDELELVTTTTTTTTTVPPESYFKISPQNLSAYYMNKFTLSFLVDKIYSEYILYHWEKSVDSALSWMQISPSTYGETNKLQELTITTPKNLHTTNQPVEYELYRVVLEYPLAATSNYGTVSLREKS
jgi:hypothetical protein